MSDNRDMTLVEHLTELRQRLIWVLVTLGLTMLVGLYVAGPLITYLQKHPISSEIPLDSLASFSPSDALRVYMSFAFLVAVVLTLPVALFHIWRFVSPGLKPNERRAALRFIPAAFFLFIIGVLFGYYVVFPMIVQFMVGIAQQMGTKPVYGVGEFFGFMFNIVIPFGFLFEMPVVVMFLTRLRILNPMRLAKFRRLAYFVLAVIAVALTPPEVVSDITVTIPLLLLYEISVWLSRIVYRKQLAEDAAWESEYGYTEGKSVGESE